ncbi:MAG: tRNA lysidine(34) synthetase TilS [Sporomusaceae bacterium]|nr:tRNA lysidine(34) synthetase TilS [Sporomusaceae bacterium]
MLTKVRGWIERHKMLASSDKILVACSGGPDSLALLHIFDTIRLEYNISVFAAHVDHMFRGLESAQEAEFVVNFCKERNIICYHTAIDVPKFILETKLSTQEAARAVRYQYLRSIAEELGGAKIATGHHRDDQAETVLIHILRGAGSAGIRGIQPVNGGIIRPLLSVSRTEIAEYCAAHHLEPRFDSSNLKTNYLRNRIRITLLPELEKQYNAAIKDALCRTAVIVGDEHDFIQMTAQNMWPQVTVDQDDKLFIDTKKMQPIHIAVKREIFRIAIEKKRGCLTGVSFDHVESLLELLANGRVGSIIDLPGGLVSRKSYDGIQLGLESAAPLPKAGFLGQVLTVPGSTHIAELGIIITTEVTDELDSSGGAVFDWLALSQPLFLRTRAPGDRFQPLGFHGSKKLKDFFIDAKVPREVRDHTPIICDRQGIIWVGGYRQSEIGKLTDKTKRFLKILIKGIE